MVHVLEMRGDQHGNGGVGKENPKLELGSTKQFPESQNRKRFEHSSV
jgi:hypothetical protein